MIKFLVEYLKIVGVVIMGIVFVASLIFSVFGPVMLAFAYSLWWGLLYILTLPYLALLIDKTDK